MKPIITLLFVFILMSMNPTTEVSNKQDPLKPTVLECTELSDESCEAACHSIWEFEYLGGGEYECTLGGSSVCQAYLVEEACPPCSN